MVLRRHYGVRVPPVITLGTAGVSAPAGHLAVSAIRALVVDDHDIVREGLTLILERGGGVKVVGSAANGEQALTAARGLKPDLIVMDLVMPVLDGIDTTRRVIRELPQTRIIMVSACHAPEHVGNAMRAGARGYVLKDSAAAELHNAVLTVTGGRLYVSGAVTEMFSNGILVTSFPDSPLDRLSDREREVLRYVVAGSSSSAIAPILSLSRKTVDTYRARMMSKLGVTNRSQLIRLAMAHMLPMV